MKNRLIDLLTMCRKAGRMTMGFDAVKEDIENEKVVLLLTASDISKKSEKEILFVAEKYKVAAVKTDITKEETGFYLGRQCGIIGITDKGFAEKIKELCPQKP